MKKFTVRARRPEQVCDTRRYWMDVGFATELEDGNILVTLNALPFHFDGELRMELKPPKSPQTEVPEGTRSQT